MALSRVIMDGASRKVRHGNPRHLFTTALLCPMTRPRCLKEPASESFRLLAANQSPSATVTPSLKGRCERCPLIWLRSTSTTA